MSFEEDFPSLKGKRGTIGTDNYHNTGGYIGWADPLGELLHIEDVREHCLDKQRVREALQRLKPDSEAAWDTSAITQAVEHVERELGL